MIIFLFTQVNKIYEFAEYLYKNGDYLSAAKEFERYLILSDLPNRDLIYYKIGKCYRLSNKFERAIYYFDKIIKEYTQSPYKSGAYYEIALIYSLSEKYSESNQFISSILQYITEDSIKLKMNHLFALNYSFERRWKEASNFIENLNSNDSITFLLRNLIREGKNFHRKNKFLAGLLSAIVPGSGKIYANRFGDGITSLVSISVFSYQAYDAFRKEGMNSTKGWIFGILAGIFYLGNIYGSIVSAEIYNTTKEEQILHSIQIYVNANIF
jgi:tetratricopeptide (TPR) repeat protein